jgi:CHRD domain
MKLIKLTALSSLLFVFLPGMTSCEKNAEKKKTTDYEKTGIIMSGAQETPVVPSSALGTMDVFYSKETRTLTYKVTWSGLTDSLSLMHIHGLGPTGFAAGVVQNIVTAANGIYPQKTNGKYTFLKSGTISGSLLVDGVVVKEQDLLNGVYYMNIHTPVYPAGEIRGQITFQ